MADYELDVPAQAIVAWLLATVKQGEHGLEIRAAREYVAGAASSDEGAAEVAEVAAIGTLEVEPIGEGDPWVLRVRVEDELGDRLPDDEPVPDGPEDIDLPTFWDDFLVTDRGTATALVSAPDRATWHRFERFLERIQKATPHI